MQSYASPLRSLCVAIAAGLLGAPLGCHRTEPAASNTSPAPPAQTVAAVAGPTWRTESLYVYEVDLASEALLGPDNSMLDFDLKARLELRPRRQDGSNVELAATLRDPSFTSRAGKEQARFDDLQKELSRPFAFTLSQGRLHEVRLPRGASDFAASICRTLSAAVQFSAGPSPADWTAEETDATGKYVAEYHALPEAGRYSKKKLRYAPVSAPTRATARSLVAGLPSVEVVPAVAASSGEIDVEGDGRLTAVSQHDELLVTVMQASPIRSKTSLSLRFAQQTENAPAPDWDQLVAETVKVAAGEPYVGPARKLDLDAARIGGLTFEEALKQLEAQEQDPKKKELWSQQGGEALSPDERAEREGHAREEAHVFIALAALIRQEPATVGKVVAKVKQGSLATKALLDALASANTDAAQSALVKLVTDAKLDKELRTRAASSLIRVRLPSAQAVDALAPLLDDRLLGVHATFGLGTFARRLREAGEGARSDKISRVLVERLRTVKLNSERMVVLRGIANSAFVGALDAVRPYLADQDPSVRLAAVQSLRRMNHPDAHALIAERLEKDATPKVRVAALEAAANVPAASSLLRDAVARAATNALDVHSRLEAVRILGRWLGDHAELRVTLERAAETDSEAVVREAAKAALQS
jgi:hypothetical protein